MKPAGRRQPWPPRLAPTPLRHLYPERAPNLPLGGEAVAPWGAVPAQRGWDAPTTPSKTARSAAGASRARALPGSEGPSAGPGGPWCPSRAVPGMGMSQRALASAPAPRSSLLSGLISRCLLVALNMSRARGGRKEPLLPGDGVEAKPHAPAPPPPPSHSLPGTATPPPCPRARHEPGAGKASPLSKKSPPRLTRLGTGCGEPPASPKLCAERGLPRD